ncbi:Protein of unknown function [Roseovarius litoreus]|uniref:DUF3047 domain-containing protein n=1 Tax=Roseovarius litoreus TaxID=1155722 RepID=A0A1M7FA55_9RHOB|nr:DUF3047 domain-containing protein [Roseovarius litoreus]SHM00941.1 Protein of unknown function [Roseovarius litoreus]
MRLALSTGVMALAATMASASPIAFDGSWKHQKFSLFSGNDYALRGGALDMVSDASVSLLYRAVPETAWQASNASWLWQVSQSVPPTDLALKGGDDRNLAMYFVFLPQAEAERARGSRVTRLLSHEDVRVLVYVWGGDHAPGAFLDSPYLGPRGKTVVLRPAGTGEARERVDLAADFARAFGGERTALVGLAVSGDSDDTNTRITGRISGLTLQ